MKGKLGWCKRIGISVQENSSKWATTSKIKRSRPGDWHIPGTVVRKAEGYNLSEVQSAVSSPPLKNTTKQTPTPWARSLNVYEDGLCCFPPRYMRMLQNIQEQETRRLKTVHSWPRKK